MGGSRLHGVHDALEVVVRVRGDLGEPDHLLGEDALTVDDGRHLPVGPASIEADAAALQMPAHGLGVALLRGQLVAGQHLEGMLVHLGHEVRVKGPGAAGGVGLLQGPQDLRVPLDEDAEAALHPEHRLHQPVHVVAVRLRHVRRAVDEGSAHGRLAVRALHRQAQRLAGILQERPVELIQRDESRVQFRHAAGRDLNSITIHVSYLQETEEFIGVPDGDSSLQIIIPHPGRLVTQKMIIIFSIYFY